MRLGLNVVAEMDRSQGKRMHCRAANCKTIPAAATSSQRLARSLSILDTAVGKKARRTCGASIKSWQWAFLHFEPFTADTHVLSLYFSLSCLAVYVSDSSACFRALK